MRRIATLVLGLGLVACARGPGGSVQADPVEATADVGGAPDAAPSQGQAMDAATALLAAEQDGDMDPSRFRRAVLGLEGQLETGEHAPDTIYLALALLYARYAPKEAFPSPDGGPPATLDDGNLREPVERAVTFLEHAVEANPSNRAALRLLAFLLENLDDERAVRNWQRLVTLQPDHLEGLNRLGEGLLLLKRYPEAEQTGLRALAVAEAQGSEEGAGIARNLLGRAYLQTGRYDLAERMFEDAAVRSDGSHWGCAYQSLGQLYATLGELGGEGGGPQPTAAGPSTGQDRPTDGPLAALRRALQLHDSGDTAAALIQAREARTQGDRPEFLALEALLLVALEQDDQALRLATEARSRAPGAPGPSAALAELAMRQGDLPGAQRHLEHSIAAWQGKNISRSGLPGYYALVHAMACDLHGRLRIEQQDAGKPQPTDKAQALAHAVCGMNLRSR